MRKIVILFLLIVPSLGGCAHFELEENSILPPSQGKSHFSTKGPKRDEVFYYYFDQRIPLQERHDLIFIRFRDELSQEHFLSDRHITTYFTAWTPRKEATSSHSSIISVIQSTNGEFAEDFIVSLSEREDINYVSYILDYQGRFSAADHFFSVKLKKNSDLTNLQVLTKKYGCDLIREELSGENIYFVQVRKTAEQTAIQLSDTFYETGLFEFASPAFIAFDALASNDPFYNYQWGLSGSGPLGTTGTPINITQAWSITEGSSDVIVAVLDDGVELNHPDLTNRLVTGYEYQNNTAGAPVYSTEYHGTAVAGIIGASKDNSIGISGVAPGCKIMPIRVLDDDYLNYTKAVEGIYWARNNGADVINCSWRASIPCALLTNALNNVPGCVVVFAAGNDGSTVNYPASLTSVIAVGATTFDRSRAYFSSYGVELDLSAPGVSIMTTDRQGDNGWNNTNSSSFDCSNRDYTWLFDGTSAAAPFVSGVAALILSKYPDLSKSQVQRALELGCSRPSGYAFSLDSHYPAGYWNNELGYGYLNAYQSLYQASILHQQNVLDGTAGIDIYVDNGSGVDLEDVAVLLQGKINGVVTTLISCIIPDLHDGHPEGYPVYRGEIISAASGTIITDLHLEVSAHTGIYGQDVRIAAGIDESVFSDYDDFFFSTLSSTYQCSLPNTTVPNASRRMLTIDITY